MSILSPRKRNVFDLLEQFKKEDDASSSKNLVVRVDFNVPMNAQGEITDESRIRGALPTLQAIVNQGCNAILLSHMGRPKLVQKGEDTDGKQRKQLSLRPVAAKLSELMGGRKVIFGEDCQGLKAKAAVDQLPSSGGGGIVLLENVRFYKGEEKNEADFAKGILESIGNVDGYVNDAFGTCHRAHASVYGIPKLLDPQVCGVGCLVASEIAFLDFGAIPEGERVSAIIGGSKVSTKLPVIKGLLNQVDTLVLGGGLAFTFLKAQGVPIGNSLVEESMIETAKELLEEAQAKGKTLFIPLDAVCVQDFPKDSAAAMAMDIQTFDLVPSQGIQDGWMGLDVGPKTVEALTKVLTGSSKLVFNGPMGVFEIPPFDVGTKGLVDLLARLTKDEGCVTVVGGGDSVAALEAFGRMKDVSYVSTGGGATLELLAGDVLPGVEAIGTIE